MKMKDILKLFKIKKSKPEETKVVKTITVDLSPELKVALELVDHKFNLYDKRMKILEEKYDRLPQTNKPSDVILTEIGKDGVKKYYNSRKEEV